MKGPCWVQGGLDPAPWVDLVNVTCLCALANGRIHLKKRVHFGSRPTLGSMGPNLYVWTLHPSPQVWRGQARFGLARQGKVRHGRAGSGLAGRGGGGVGLGVAQRGKAWSGLARSGRARRGSVEPGMVRRVLARRGRARQGFNKPSGKGEPYCAISHCL